jgi:hypothetical protein
MHKFLVALGAVAFALSTTGVAEAKKPVPKATTTAKAKYKSKCQGRLKWNAVEGKCDKKGSPKPAVAKVKVKKSAPKKKPA